tara:strand:- start:18 stop:545 length:528 start_codon:yes stop_codon:yes gene_type:complete
VKKRDILENQANIVYLALGSNLGNRILNLELAKSLIISIGINILKISSYYKTESWPNKNFPYFLNFVILINTNLELKELYKKIKIIEKVVGRTKAPKNYPRVCDIDIIDFNGINFSTKYKNNDIIVPHKSMHKRNFVLLPLFEINRNWIHPKFKKNIVNLVSKMSNLDLRCINLM